MVERNGTDYAIYLNRVFGDDPDFRQAADYWAAGGSAARRRAGQMGDAGRPVLGLCDRVRPLQGRLPIAAGCPSLDPRLTHRRTDRALHGGDRHLQLLHRAGRGDASEPVLQQICRHIAADEYRHFKLFYDHMRRYLARENIGLLRRLRIAASRITESEDDELAYAWHCGNEPAGRRMSTAAAPPPTWPAPWRYYRFRHIERGMGMIFKAVGLPPRGRLSDVSAKAAWRLMQWRRQRFVARGWPRRSPAALQHVHEHTHRHDRDHEQHQRAQRADHAGGGIHSGSSLRPVIIGRTRSCRFITA